MRDRALLLVLVLASAAHVSAQDCSAPYATRYPVAAPVNGGYDSTLGRLGAATYNCEGLYSNSDYIASGPSAHHGNDFFAERLSPIIAVTDGVVAKAGWETGLGNRVAIHDACGWEYDAGHMDSIADGIAVGVTVHAGDVLGYMGSTGARSGGAVHLHFNVHHSSLAWSDDVNPFDVVGHLANIACLPIGPTTPAYRAEVVTQSFPLSAEPFDLHAGELVPGFIEVRNTGSETWRPGEVNLGTVVPRDASSPLAGPDWISAGRPATIDRVVAPGEVGRFNFTVRAPAATGDYPQYFNLVRELVTWFSDSGGPVDAFIQVRVTVIPETDADGDGFAASIDCNDASAGVFPGAVEVCGDGVDQNCDMADEPCPAGDAGMHTSDASAPGQDAGTRLGDGGGFGHDAGAADAGTRAPLETRLVGGCGCRVGPSTGRAPWAVMLLGLAVLARRSPGRRARLIRREHRPL